MRLILVELNRFRSRRAIALLGLAAVLFAVVLVGKTAWDTRPLTHEDRGDAVAQAQLEGSAPRSSRRSAPAGPTRRTTSAPDATARRLRGRAHPRPGRVLPARPAAACGRCCLRRGSASRWPWSSPG